MVGRTVDDDGSIADLPWASVFDPAANVRALGAIQARGFRAASDVVDRFVRLTERGFGAMSASTPEGQHDGVDSATYPELGRVLASLQGVVSQLGQSVRGPANAAEPTLDLVNSAATGEAYLEAAEPGPTVTEVWLHNRGSEDLGKVRLRCSDLLSHDGT